MTNEKRSINITSVKKKAHCSYVRWEMVAFLFSLHLPSCTIVSRKYRQISMLCPTPKGKGSKTFKKSTLLLKEYIKRLKLSLKIWLVIGTTISKLLTLSLAHPDKKKTKMITNACKIHRQNISHILYSLCSA